MRAQDMPGMPGMNMYSRDDLAGMMDGGAYGDGDEDLDEAEGGGGGGFTVDDEDYAYDGDGEQGGEAGFGALYNRFWGEMSRAAGG
jgi:hypothetical protein